MPKEAVPRGYGGLITTISHNDVFSGRGSNVNNKPGNINFRRFVEAYRGEYQEPGTTRPMKSRLAAQLVAEIRRLNPPGRFLVEDVNNRGIYTEIGDKQASNKAKQCLRETDRQPDIKDHAHSNSNTREWTTWSEHRNRYQHDAGAAIFNHLSVNFHHQPHNMLFGAQNYYPHLNNHVQGSVREIERRSDEMKDLNRMPPLEMASERPYQIQRRSDEMKASIRMLPPEMASEGPYRIERRSDEKKASIRMLPPEMASERPYQIQRRSDEMKPSSRMPPPEMASERPYQMYVSRKVNVPLKRKTPPETPSEPLEPTQSERKPQEIRKGLKQNPPSGPFFGTNYCSHLNNHVQGSIRGIENSSGEMKSLIRKPSPGMTSEHTNPKYFSRQISKPSKRNLPPEKPSGPSEPKQSERKPQATGK